MLSRLISRSLSCLTQHCSLSNSTREKDVNVNNIRCVVADSCKPLPVIIPTTGVPIHLYTHEVESQALQQLTTLAESGIVKGFVAAMADVHVGKTHGIILFN